MVISKKALEAELEDEGLEADNFAGWINHYKRCIWVSDEGNAFDLLLRICHELVHAITYVKGDKHARSWTKEGEAYTDSWAYALATLFQNTELVQYLAALGGKSKQREE